MLMFSLRTYYLKGPFPGRSPVCCGRSQTKTTLGVEGELSFRSYDRITEVTDGNDSLASLTTRGISRSEYSSPNLQLHWTVFLRTESKNNKIKSFLSGDFVHFCSVPSSPNSGLFSAVYSLVYYLVSP